MSESLERVTATRQQESFEAYWPALDVWFEVRAVPEGIGLYFPDLVAVRYRPAAQEAQVRGDGYDAFFTADGATCLVIGDVAGHDGEAAASMGQIRNLLRGLDPDTVRAAHSVDVATGATVLLYTDALLECIGEASEDDVALLALRAFDQHHPRPAEAGPELLPRQLVELRRD